MPELHIDLERTSFRLGEVMNVTVQWQLQERPETLLVTLLWFTSGKGDEDIGIAEQETIEATSRSGTRTISFRAPRLPPSFSGTLITLTWAVEAMVEPKGTVARTEVTIAPAGEELVI